MFLKFFSIQVEINHLQKKIKNLKYNQQGRIPK
jgi:hypothetical protein